MMKDNTMKNSASNLTITQALQTQSRQLLPVITQTLSKLAYEEITHQRISQQVTCYQGLTRAQHSKYDRVMIKWELRATSDRCQSVSDLTHEISVLRALYNWQKTQASSIAPLLLFSYEEDIKVLEQSQRLTVLVMPYYKNGSLAKLLNHHVSLTDKQKHDLIKESAHLVCNLHNAGWLHNDIKPSNILLSNALMVSKDMESSNNNCMLPDLLLTDFALVRKIDHSREANSAGTAAYLAPERWQGQRATIQSDIYAFGVMMVEILIGKRAFNIDAQSQQSMTDWAIQHCQQPIPRLPLKYSHYQSIVDNTLAKRVEKRYQSMEIILEELGKI